MIAFDWAVRREFFPPYEIRVTIAWRAGFSVFRGNVHFAFMQSSPQDLCMFKNFQKRHPDLRKAKAILGVFDQAAEAFMFPMLDNGYVYLAASRLSVFKSDKY